MTSSGRALSWRCRASTKTARQLAFRLTQWSKALDPKERRFVVCTGGGPGIMEAANRGAAEARGLNVGLTISIPIEEFDNQYVTRELAFHFHYFFMRKFWFAYLAKAVIVFPGGYGTLDELFELLTLVQTRKMTKPMPIVLFGTNYWRQVIDFDALVRYGTISPDDVNLVYRTDSVDDAYEWIVRRLGEEAMDQPGRYALAYRLLLEPQRRGGAENCKSSELTQLDTCGLVECMRSARVAVTCATRLPAVLCASAPLRFRR